MRVVKLALVVSILSTAGLSTFAQETGIHVRAVRVLATDPEALATFYMKAFGMSETRRPPLSSATTKEIVLNSGSTPERARQATSATVVIYTRPPNAPAGAMASLILDVPDLEKTIESVKANGGTLMRPAAKSGEGLAYAFVKDPDGNQIELVMQPKF
jgi:predicted enzyme related to lactoylglutathione lyase